MVCGDFLTTAHIYQCCTVYCNFLQFIFLLFYKKPGTTLKIFLWLVNEKCCVSYLNSFWTFSWVIREVKIFPLAWFQEMYGFSFKRYQEVFFFLHVHEVVYNYLSLWLKGLSPVRGNVLKKLSEIKWSGLVGVYVLVGVCFEVSKA